jgi:hypothetical protein
MAFWSEKAVLEVEHSSRTRRSASNLLDWPSLGPVSWGLSRKGENIVKGIGSRYSEGALVISVDKCKIYYMVVLFEC